MKIALFASSFYPHVGGVEELVRQLAREYRGRGFSPVIITNRWPRSLPEYELHEEVPLYRLPMRTPGPGVKARLSYLCTHRGIRRKLLDILRRHGTELLHVQCVSSNALYALAAKQALGLPLVLTTQGERTMDAAQIYQRWPFMSHLLRQSLAAADHVTACSAATLEDLERFAGRSLDPRHAEVVYNGIAPGDFAGASGAARSKPYLLAIGRFVPQKGFDVLLRAYAQAGLIEHELVLAGEGPERETLEALTERLGIQDRVHFTGRVDRPQAAALFKGCAFFVLPSRQEPLGIVNLEAMAAGKAVVATRVGGVPEIVLDGETSLLVPGEDAPALSAALRRLAARPDLRVALGEAGRQRAKGFTWSHIADQYARIYCGLLERSPARRSNATSHSASGAASPLTGQIVGRSS